MFLKIRIKKSKILVYIFFLFILFISCIYKNTYAQTISLSITPPIVELIIKPGKSVLISYSVENRGDPTVLKTRVIPITTNNIFGLPVQDSYKKSPINFRLDNSNLSLSDARFTKSKDIFQYLLRISVPNETPEGDYYYSFQVFSEPNYSLGSQVTPRNQATISSNIIISVTNTGRLEAKGSIIKFGFISKKFPVFDSTEYIPVELIIENKGKNVFKPEGEISLTGNFGEKSTYSIVPVNVIAGSARIIPATPSVNLNCDNKKNKICTRPFSLILKGFFVGKYSLKAKVQIANNKEPLIAEKTFYAIPFTIGFLFAIICIFTLSIVFMTKKKIQS